MTRRRWRIRRMMVVPAQWQGSVEHFYHFFLGYLMPVIVWQERTGTEAFTVRDCGPMNPWFSLVRPGTDLDFMPPGVMLERALTRRQEMQILHGWDDPTRFHRASLDTFVRAVKGRVGPGARVDSNGPRITLLERAPSPDFYLSAAAETHGSGADWRSIPNTAALAQALASVGVVSVLDTAACSPVQQVHSLMGTDLLVAQHGAGLANMVWMPSGSSVLEIKPPLAPTINEIFASLASARGFNHLSVEQLDDHAPIDIESVVRAAERMLASPGAFIPPMPGRLPMRLVRQLPRRL